MDINLIIIKFCAKFHCKFPTYKGGKTRYQWNTKALKFYHNLLFLLKFWENFTYVDTFYGTLLLVKFCAKFHWKCGNPKPISKGHKFQDTTSFINILRYYNCMQIFFLFLIIHTLYHFLSINFLSALMCITIDLIHLSHSINRSGIVSKHLNYIHIRFIMILNINPVTIIQTMLKDITISY